MARNPWDYTEILLSNRAGANLGAGIEQAASAVAKGIQGYREQKKVKEAEAAAVDWLKKNATNFGLPINVQDEGEIKAAVKAAGGGPQAIAMISGLQRQQQMMELQKQQLAQGNFILEQSKAAAAEQQAQQGAMAAAAGGRPTNRQAGAMIMNGARFEDLRGNPGASPEQAVLGYLSKTGDATGAARLASTFGNLADVADAGSQFVPQVIDLGNGVKGVTTSRKSAVPLVDPNADKGKMRSPQGKLLEDAAALEASGDTNGAQALRAVAAKAAAGKPMSLTDYLIAGGSADDYRAYVESFNRELTGQPAPAQPAAPGKPPSPEDARAELRRRQLQRQRG